jgi:AcrR family transcriptional regulator
VKYAAGVAKRVRLEKDERREQIITAARPLLSTRPYDEVSLTDIADAAGVTRGLLHHYFGSKRDLYLAIVRDAFRVPLFPVPEDVPGLRSTEVWERSVDRWIDAVEADRGLWVAALDVGGIGHDAEVRTLLDAGREAVANRAFAAMGIGEPTPTMLALVRAYGGFSEEIAREWLIRGRLDREQVRVLLGGSMPLLVRELFSLVVEVPSRPVAPPTG